ncbi:MAG: sugar ABC transporter ATP-binding protein [Clostridiales Family XIII bacterium]|nr:sugar ABC transporter ATP-binding protein [Clostridiales Family XIII bacterium]
MMSERQTLLTVEHLTKRYPGVVALDDVHFELRAGEVHALIGENGAGKSTLIKALMGIIPVDGGAFFLNGEPASIRSPQEAMGYGITAVFQELSQILDLTVAENVFLSKEGKKAAYWLDRHVLNSRTQEILDRYNISELRPMDMLRSMSAAKRQLAEIVKAVAIEPKILILDEPTSSLTDTEAEKLFDIIRVLKADGVGIIYISHRMMELEQIADRVTVLRDGVYVGTREMAETTMDEIVEMMVGRSLELYQSRQKRPIDRSEGCKLLEVSGLRRKGTFDGISFDVYKGEILGIAGLVGSGRSELANMIFGIDPADGGEIRMEGKPVRIRSVQDALDHGIAMIPESRHQQGLVLIHSIADNITLPILKRFQHNLLLSHRKKSEFAGGMIEKYAVKTESPAKIVNQLSGGNQQKVVVAKWLATAPKLLIIDEPTAGIDVNAKVEIHKMILQLTELGLGVIMISSEMTELLNHSDRVMIMNRFRNLGIYEDVDQETIMSEIMQDENAAAENGLTA